MRSQTASTSLSRWELRKNSDPLAAEAPDEVADVASAEGIQGRGWLVQDDQTWLGQECLSDPDPLLHAFGVGSHAPSCCFGEADQFQDLGDPATPLGTAQPVELSMQVEEFLAGQPVMEPEKFRQIADLTACSIVAEGATEYPASASGRPDEADQYLDGRGFASAVGTQEAEHFPVADGDREVLECHSITVDLAEAPRFDRPFGLAAW
jgi:hypothetical protein